MAELSGSILGRLSGSIGDITFLRRNGKVFIRRRSKSFVPGHDQESVNRRSRFSLAGKLARAIYSIPELKAFWQQVTPKGKSAFNIMVQKNICLVNPDSVSGVTTITPEVGFAINCTSSSISKDAIVVELAALGSSVGIDTSGEPSVKLAYVLSLTNPSNSTFPEFLFVSGTSDTGQLTLDTALTFNIALSGQDAARVGSYGEKKLLLALLTLDSENKPVKYSSTLQASGAQD